ncbi:MAG: hypothetical protein ABFS23_01450, partial [Pseudomonadota bacterium]
NTRVRRWDQSGTVRTEDGTEVQNLDAPGSAGEILIAAAGTRLFLEHGILVEFDLDPAGGEFRSGDHWVFAARSVDASIEILDRAPPLGIHHHYTKLAIVDFPDGETDCRTLWPPVAEGTGCDCTVCVTAEGHNSGTATLQQAIDSIKDSGGTLCLGIGTYEMREPLNIDGARSLRIRGQGWGTLLVGSQPGGLVAIRRSTGVALENFTLIASAGNAGSTAVIAASNVVDLQAEHINVLGLAAGDGISVGIGLSGFVLGATITACGIVAARGIATTTLDDRNFLLAGELRVQRNLLLCGQRAISLDGTSLHYGVTAIRDNLMLAGTQAAIVATGAALPGSPVRISENAIYTAGDGIRAGVGGLGIEGNEITGIGERSGDGIRLEEGIDPIALDDVRVDRNRLLGLRGNGIAISQRVGSAIITDNLMKGLGLGALVMAGRGAAGTLRFAGNQCVDLGQAVNQDLGFAAVQLIRVGRSDVLDNLVARVAQGNDAVTAPAVFGFRGAAIGQLRLAGNRLEGIGPDRAAEMAAARLLPPFDNTAINDNHMVRLADGRQNANPADWRAIDISPERSPGHRFLAAASHFASAETAYLMTENQVVGMPQRPSQASIRGNLLRGQSTRVTLNRCVSVDHCLFADNHCETVGEPGKEPLLALLEGRTLNASNNRLVGRGDMHTLHLHPQVERAIVMGNTSTGPIDVKGGSPVPPDINLTNIIGP